MQAARQAAQKKKAEVAEVSQEAAAPLQAATTLPAPLVQKLPVGVSSIHVDYNYFEVGTGQVDETDDEDGIAGSLFKSQNVQT